MDKENKIQNKIVQTYAEDMAQVIQDDREGLVKKIIHGEQEHEMNKKNLSPVSLKNRFFLFMSFIFLAVSLGTLFYFLTKREAPIVSVQQQFTPLIFNDRSTFLEVSGMNKDEVAQTVANAINNTSVKNGEVDGIYLMENKKVIGLRRFLSLIKANFVPAPDPIFVSDNFLLGVVNSQNKSVTGENGSKDFFMIIKVRSLADIFDSLRAWEGKMFTDLHGFFGVDISSETKYLLTANFTDGIIENKNARVLYDKDGKIIVMYIYADENSVVVTNTENAAQEIMLRLASSRVKK